MTIAIDISPLQSGHSIRGVGSYVRNLKENLEKYENENDYVFLDNLKNHNIHGNVELLHIPYFDPFFIHLPLKKITKLVVTVHDLTPLIFPTLFPVGIRGRIKWNINKQLLKRADAIITDSNSSKNDIHKFTGISLNKIHTVYLAAGPEFQHIDLPRTVSNQLRSKYRLPEQFVLYVGDVTANKNLPRLIEAVKQLNITLVLVGKSLVSKDYDKSNPWNHDLSRIQNEMINDNRFISLGFVHQHDLVALYNMATLSVLPSLYEGFGLPVLEAMQSGCPVVTTKSGSLPEVGGEAVYYVDPTDVQSIANGVGNVFFSKKIQDQLTDKGIKQAKKFSWKKTLEQMIQVYEDVLLPKPTL